MHKIGINYELVYKVRQLNLSFDDIKNRRAQYENEARAKADKEHNEVVKQLTRLLGHDDFDFSNIACMADGISCHVYSPIKDTPKNVGKRICVFCGCDDFDGF